MGVRSGSRFLGCALSTPRIRPLALPRQTIQRRMKNTQPEALFTEYMTLLRTQQLTPSTPTLRVHSIGTLGIPIHSDTKTQVLDTSVRRTAARTEPTNSETVSLEQNASQALLALSCRNDTSPKDQSILDNLSATDNRNSDGDKEKKTNDDIWNELKKGIASDPRFESTFFPSKCISHTTGSVSCKV